MKNYEVITENICNAKERYIVHQVNCMGVMGAGVAKALRCKYKGLYESYAAYCKKNSYSEELGGTIHLFNTLDKCIINMFSQYRYGRDKQHTNYNWMKTCLKMISEQVPEGESIAFPYNIGCGLAGGNWDIVLPLICNELKNHNVIFYKL